MENQSELELNKLLRAVRREIDEYDKERRKEGKIARALLKEVTLTIHVRNIKEVGGKLRIFIADLGGRGKLEKTHTIMLKFVVPEGEIESRSENVVVTGFTRYETSPSSTQERKKRKKGKA